MSRFICRSSSDCCLIEATSTCLSAASIGEAEEAPATARARSIDAKVLMFNNVNLENLYNNNSALVANSSRHRTSRIFFESGKNLAREQHIARANHGNAMAHARSIAAKSSADIYSLWTGRWLGAAMRKVFSVDVGIQNITNPAQKDASRV